MDELLAPAEVRPGLFKIPVPIMGLPIANTHVYAFDAPSGPVLIDAGWNDEVAWQALTGGLVKVGLAIADVRGVVVTHHHPDHAGLAGRIREVSGAWLAMHEADADLMRRHEDYESVEPFAEWELNNLRRAGASEADVQAYAATGGSADMAKAPARPDIELSDGDLIDLPGQHLRVVWTPGHTPGHICLYREEDELLFAGDHILSKTTPMVGSHVYPLDEQDPLGNFLDALAKVARLPVSEVLPAHEDSVDDLPGRVAEIIAHHDVRLDQLRSALDRTDLTLWEAAAALSWNQAWEEMAPLSKQLALAEAAAHMRLLVTRSQARPIPGTEPARFTAKAV